MNLAAAAASPSNLSRFIFNSDAQALGHFDRSHRLVLLCGGVGSGKTVLHGLDLIERSRTETDQLHGIFTNTQNQLEKGVLPEIFKICAQAGMEQPVYDKRPPKSWFARWARDGVEIPLVARYRGVLTAPTGYHALCGTLFNQSYYQYQTIQLGSIRIEEAINASLPAVIFMIERLRCGLGPERCRQRQHHHQAYLIFNPPLGPHPWLYTYLDQLEETAKRFYIGPPLDHRNWPLLKRGVGDATLIQSRTSDNSKNLNAGYESGLAANYSKDTAKRRLEGEIVREVAGRAYTEFSSENVRRVGYDPSRTLFLCLDFNSEPRAAVLAHPLVPGRDEYSTDYERPEVRHLGVFGELFIADKLSDRKFAQALVKGDRGSGGTYRDEELRGIPANWKGLKGHKARIIAYGDAVGTHRSSHADNLESSWEIVDQVCRQLGSYGKDLPSDGNPSPRARVDSVNGKLCNVFDVRSLWIDPRCAELIRDFEQVMWDDTGMALREWRRGSLGTEWHRTHLSDALGYMVHRRFPLGRDGADDDEQAAKLPAPRPRRPSFI